MADDQKDFGCAMATHTSTRGEGSISIINSTQNILSSDYCVLFQVREGDVTLVCEDQKPNLEMPIAEPNMAITDTGVIDPSSTQSVLTDIVSSNKTILSTTTETNTIINTTSSSLNNTGAGNNVTAFDNIGNATASELRRLFANTQISEDKMSGFLNKYPDLRELIIEPVTLSDLIDNSTKGLFAEFARESFTDTHGRLQPEVTSPLILLTEKQPISTAPPTEQTTQLPTTTIVLDQPVADKNTIMEKYPEINETVFEPVPEGLLDLIKPIEDAILPKTTVTPVDESMSTGKEVKPVTSTVLFSSPISTAASMDGVSSQVSSTNIPDISSNKDVFRSLDLTTSTPVHSKNSTETAVNKSIILEKYSNASNVIIEPVSHEIFNSLQNKSSSVSNTSSTTISDISTADFTTDVQVVNKSAILEKYSNLSNVTFEPVANESSTIFTNESTVETTDIPFVNKSAIFEKYSDLTNVTFEPVAIESSTIFTNESTVETIDIPFVNKSAIFEKYSDLTNVTFEPVANESSTIFTNESTVETTDIPSVNKSAILEKYSDLTNVTFEPVANESSTIFTNESTVKTTDIPSVNKSAILDKYSDLSNVTFEPVSYESSTIFSNESIAETTDIPSVNKTAIFEKYSDLSNVTFEPVSHESSTTFSNESTAETTDTFTFSRSAIVEKHSNMSDVIIEPVTEETFLLLKNKTTPYFNTTKVTTDPVISGESDIISTTDSPIVDKSTILEKHSNLSGIIIEPATEETLALLQNGTTALPDSLVRTEESLTWKKNISDVMADIPVVNKSSILEKYSNLSDITIEPASYENFTSSKQNQSTTELNTAEVIRDNTTPLLPASGLPNNKSTDLNNLAYPVDSTTESSIENNTSTSLGNDTLALTNSSRHLRYS
ncbi:hypothetical protein KUTeg_006991 [Tegillarca granosa]|uniref:Uncharacterized protein n=1 Tax=Tegillarca granosa TaxID=220873 RepID=A0ABQ9FBY1_TEGGR|nr:hypothetical protein KUTeg_006991 [Tegillarca granosa]